MPLTALQQRKEDRPFNPWRHLAEEASPFLRVVLALLSSQRGDKNRRNPQDQVRYECLVEALISDLAYNVLLNEPVAIHLTRANKELSKKFQRRYRPEFLNGKMLPTLLDDMQTCGLIEMRKGHRGPRRTDGVSMDQTRIVAGPVFVTLLKQYRVSANQLCSNYEGQEIVVLKGFKDETCSDADLTDYQDTPQTLAYRQEVDTINDWLQSAPLSVSSHINMTVDLRERRLRRYFTRSNFESGGRLFGGFWQPMTKADRLVHLRIVGEEVVEKDYSSMLPRLLYGTAQQSIPSTLVNDPYRVPGFERSRAGIKKLFSALLFHREGEVRTRFPDGSLPLFDAQELHRVGGKVQPVIESIKETHYPVSQHFETEVGYSLMFQESQILVAVLLALRERKAYALPIHDALVTSQRDARVTELVMLETFQRMVGQAGKVTTLTHRDLLNMKKTA